MSNVAQKYLKDKDGNIFSPITSTNSIYKNNESLDKYLDYELLYEGKATGGDNITLKNTALELNQYKALTAITGSSTKEYEGALTYNVSPSQDDWFFLHKIFSTNNRAYYLQIHLLVLNKIGTKQYNLLSNYWVYLYRLYGLR